MASQFASELGRLATTSALPPSFSHSAAIFLRPSALLAVMTTLAPAAASVLAAMAPNAPVAPVTIAVLPLTSNRDSGFFRKSSDIGAPRFSNLSCPAQAGHPVIASQTASSLALPITGSSACADDDGAARHHFTGATATAMVQTSFDRLMISRLSLGPM